MKINSINSPSFQKTLIAKAVIGDKSNPQPVRIYHMDDIDDSQEISEKFTKNGWEDSRYGMYLPLVFETDYCPNKYLVMENEDEEVICFANINDDFILYPKHEEYTELVTLETAPEFSRETNQNRKYKYAGETMVACVVKLAKKDGKSYVKLKARETSFVMQFYKNQCKFEFNQSNDGILDSAKFDDMLRSNAEHINHSLDILI